MIQKPRTTKFQARCCGRFAPKSATIGQKLSATAVRRSGMRQALDDSTAAAASSEALQAMTAASDQHQGLASVVRAMSLRQASKMPHPAASAAAATSAPAHAGRSQARSAAASVGINGIFDASNPAAPFGCRRGSCGPGWLDDSRSAQVHKAMQAAQSSWRLRRLRKCCKKSTEAVAAVDSSGMLAWDSSRAVARR